MDTQRAMVGMLMGVRGRKKEGCGGRRDEASWGWRGAVGGLLS